MPLLHPSPKSAVWWVSTGPCAPCSIDGLCPRLFVVSGHHAARPAGTCWTSLVMGHWRCQKQETQSHLQVRCRATAASSCQGFVKHYAANGGTHAFSVVSTSTACQGAGILCSSSLKHICPTTWTPVDPALSASAQLLSHMYMSALSTLALPGQQQHRHASAPAKVWSCLVDTLQFNLGRSIWQAANEVAP